MLFVKFYVSTFLLCSIYWQFPIIMFMLMLHLFELCDIISTHLFESYPKIDKIHGQARHADIASTTRYTQSTTLGHANKDDPICETGRFVILRY